LRYEHAEKHREIDCGILCGALMYGQMDLGKWIYGMIMRDMIKYQKEIKKVGEEGGRTKKFNQ